MGEEGDQTTRPDTSPRKADKSWIPPRKRTTKRITSAEDVLPRSLDPMYQGMKRSSAIAKHALFANYRAEVSLRRSLGTYNNICREEVSTISHGQRQLTKDYRSKERRKISIDRVRSAPPVPRTVGDRKYSYVSAQTRQSAISGFSTPAVDFDSDDSDDSDAKPRSASTNWNRFKKKLASRPRSAPRPSFFMTEGEQLWPAKDQKQRKRPMTAMELIENARPLPSRIDPLDVDQQKLRTSSYYRRMTSPSLQGVVSNELAVFFRQMRIKV